MNSFDAMKEMSSRDMSIKLSKNFVSAQLTKKGGEVTMGVDRETIMELMSENPPMLALFVIDVEQFKSIMKEKE